MDNKYIFVGSIIITITLVFLIMLFIGELDKRAQERRKRFMIPREEMKKWHAFIIDEGIKAILNYSDNYEEHNPSVRYEIMTSTDFFRGQWHCIKDHVLYALNDQTKDTLRFFIESIARDLGEKITIASKIALFQASIEQNFELFETVPGNEQEMLDFEKQFSALKINMGKVLSNFETK